MAVGQGTQAVELAKALSHPLRQRLLAAYSERPASPGELADRLGEPLGNVAYHTKRLVEQGFLQLVDVRPGRGGVRHTYRAIVRFEVEDATWRELPHSLQASLSSRTVSDIAADVAAGSAAGAFEEHDVHLSRVSLALDEQGHRELSDALRETISRADAIAAASARRASTTRRSVLAVLHFRAG